MRGELIITIVDSSEGPEFDRRQLAVVGSTVITWINRTADRQAVLPDTLETHGVITLAPYGTPGDRVQALLQPHRQPPMPGRVYQWRLQSAPAARITITCL